MCERQRRGVQQLPRGERLESLRFDARRRRDPAAAAERVLAIPHNRTPDVREMHANLMRASRTEPDAQQIAVRKLRDTRGVRDGMAAARRDRHPLALFGVPRDRSFDVDRRLPQMSPHQRRVDALHLAAFDRRGETAVREIGLRDDEQSRRVAVEPVHDSRPAFRRPARQVGAAADQDVDEGVVPMPRAGMDDEAGRLVEHGEVLVLVHEAQVRVRGRVGAWWRLVGRQFDGDFIPALEQRGGAQHFAARGDALIGDETSGLSTGKGELVGEESIETFGLCHDAKGDVQGSAARASFARCCARLSCHSESPSAIAPIVIAESATLNVGQRQAPIPTSTKSTTPCALRIRSTRLPTAPPQTNASAISRNRSPGRVPRTSDASTTSATMASPRKIQRELSPRCSPNAAPSLYTRRSCTTSSRTDSGRRRARNDSAMSLVTKSDTTIAVAVPQNNRRSAALSIFLFGLALDAEAGGGPRVEASEAARLAPLPPQNQKRPG